MERAKAKRRLARVARWTLGFLGGVLLLLLVTVIVLTSTPWGQGQVRELVLNQFEEVVDGEVRIGRIGGNPLRGIVLSDVAIVDAEGRPFVDAERASFRYSVPGLLRQRILLTNLRLEGARIVLDMPPGEEWNFTRIFATDEEAEPAEPRTEPGWGSWIELRDFRISESSITLRMPWEPAEELGPEARAEEIRRALTRETRERVVEVPAGYQSVMEFSDLEADVPRLIAAHPDSADVTLEVASLGLVALPFHAPGVVVEDVSGTLRIGDEAVGLEELRVELPNSSFRADGRVAYDLDQGRFELEADPLSLADLRVLHAPLPVEVEGDARVALALTEDGFRVRADRMDFRVGEGRLGGELQVVLGDMLGIEHADVTLDRIPTRLVARTFPELEFPIHGEVSGHLGAEGAGRGGGAGVEAIGAAGAQPVDVDAWLEFTDEAGRTSRAVARGWIELPEDPAELRVQDLRVTLEPLRGELVTAFAPGVPVAGTVEADLTMNGSLAAVMTLDGRIVHRDPVAGTSRITASGGLSMAPEFAFADMELRLEPVQLALAREQVAGLPPGSTLAGSIRLDGAPEVLLGVNADLRVDDPEGGVSRIVATGGVVAGDEPAFRGVEVALAPFQLRSLRGVAPADAATGTLVGSARLEGSPRQGLAFDLGLVHEEGAERSRIDLVGEVATAGEGRVVAALDAHELSLVTLGAFVPEAGLQGQASAAVRVTGDFSDLRVEAELGLPEEAVVEARATLDLSADQPGYDLRVGVRELDFSALSTRVTEPTRIEGTVAARGRGTDPARMEAALSVDLVEQGETLPGSLRAEIAVQDALADIRAFRWEGDGSDIELVGTFALDGSREGELAYRVAIESLEVLAPFVPVDPGAVEPRPAVRQATLEERDAETREALELARVEYLATGQFPGVPDPEIADTLGLSGVRTDALAGSLEAEGVVRGNPENLGVEGTLDVEELVAAGQYVDRASAAYSVTGLGGRETRASLDASAERLLLAGFGYESLSVVLAYDGLDPDDSAPVHRGRATVGVRQDAQTRILAEAGMEMAGGDLEVEVQTLVLDVDEAVYSLAAPATIRWSDGGLGVEGFRLEGMREDEEPGAIVVVDGNLPLEGEGELDIRIERLGVGHVMTLAQARDDVRGRMDLELPIRGTAARPRFEGELAVVDLHVDDRRLPDTRVRFAYADAELTADASMEEEDGRSMATVEAVLPVDLALVDAAESRLLPGPIRVEARLHELRLDGFDALSEEIEDLEGRVVGEVTVAGTFDAPEPRGSLEIDAPSLTIVPTGVRFRDITGSISLSDDVVTVDSLVAYSRGPIRISGEVDVARPSEPAFDLAVVARDTRIMNTEDVLLQADADLTIAGPFDGVEIEGEVRVREGRIRIPETRELAAPGPLNLMDPATFERVDDAFVAARDALVPPSPFAEALRVDISVFVERGMWIRSTEANVELYSPPDVGPLRVRMAGLAATDLELEGTISTDRGEYAFMGRRFDIARGSVTFTGGTVDPLVRLTAEHEVQLPGREAFDIRIVVDGTLLDLETELESTAQPPLSQTDLISLVVFGRGAGSLLQQSGSSLAGQGSSGGPLVGNMAARATQQFATVGMEALLKELEAETARALGLDVLHIQPSDTPAEVFTGRAADVLRGTEVEAGRYLTSRLFVSGNARPTFVHPGARVEYLTPGGYVWRATWRPQFLPGIPTLAIQEPDRASVLGLFLLREWRF
ncbi:MAG: translocation/assembly module TamB [Gemmatimonadales bacterium]|nr:MAG: translocation/assembly module TamB [Gemmatimonadales bacterium]